jgi:hypothetical protein
MHFRYVAPLFVACTFAALCPLWTFAQPLPRIAITEIQWGGSSLSTADEWIELANTTGDSIDISGWTLVGAGSSGATLVIPSGSYIAPYETYVISNYAPGDAKTVLATSPQLVTNSVSIPNSDLSIKVFDETVAVVDTYEDAGAPDFGSTSPHAAIERNLEDGTWLASTSSVHLTVTDTFGTPGYAAFSTISSAESAVSSDAPTTESSDPGPASSDVPLTTPETQEQSEENSPQEIQTEATTETETLSAEETTTSDESSVDISTDIPPEDVSTESDQEILLIEPIVSSPTSIVSAVIEDSESGEAEETPSTSKSQNSSAAVEYSVLTVDYSALLLHEFVSSPTDEREWVELWNSGDGPLDLSFVSLVEASGKYTTLSGVLEANSYVLVENPSGNLNNAGDTISLVLSDGQILATLTYGTDTFPAPKKGFAAGYCSDGWHTALEPSPAASNSCPTNTLESSTYASETSTTTALDSSGSSTGTSAAAQGDLPREESADSANTPFPSVTTSVIDASVTDDAGSSSTATELKDHNDNASTSAVHKKSTSKSTVINAEISELNALPSGQQVHISGVLVAAPGVFGKRIAYLHGVQLYFHRAEWPELAAGTTVEITGTWDLDTDSRRIKISDVTDIVVMNAGTAVPIALIDAIASSSSGDVLVAATGTLTKKDGELYLFTASDGSEFRVHDTAKTGALASLRAGDVATITGMLFVEDGTFVIAPRSHDDVVVSSEASISPSLTNLPTASTTSISTPSSSAPLIGGGILASSVSALGYWFIRSRKFSFLFSH